MDNLTQGLFFHNLFDEWENSEPFYHELKNQRKISIDDKKWFKLSEAGDASMEHLKSLFNKRAYELCLLTKNFDIFLSLSDEKNYSIAFVVIQKK